MNPTLRPEVPPPIWNSNGGWDSFPLFTSRTTTMSIQRLWCHPSDYPPNSRPRVVNPAVYSSMVVVGQKLEQHVYTTTRVLALLRSPYSAKIPNRVGLAEGRSQWVPNGVARSVEPSARPRPPSKSSVLSTSTDAPCVRLSRLERLRFHPQTPALPALATANRGDQQTRVILWYKSLCVPFTAISVVPTWKER